MSTTIHDQDFIIRAATMADQPEVLQLIRTHGHKPAAALSAGEFTQHLSASYFRAILNSNGVLTGTYICTKTEWKLLAMNPNFQKTQLKIALFNDIKNWATQNSARELILAPQMIVGDWKSFVKSQGAKIETTTGANAPEKIEKIVF